MDRASRDPLPCRGPPPPLLIVDDHAPVRRMVARWADRAGLPTEEAASVESAMEIVRSGGIAAVLTDVDMPGRSGIWLAGWIARNRPRVPVALMSGRALEGDFDHQPFFQKPLDLVPLRAWLEEIADAASRADA